MDIDKIIIEAKDGNAICQYILGLMYKNGWNFDVDIYQAYFWISRSANQGLPEAQFTLACILEEEKKLTNEHSSLD